MKPLLVLFWTVAACFSCKSFNENPKPLQKAKEYTVYTNFNPNRSRISIDSTQTCLYFFDYEKQGLVEYYLNQDSINSLRIRLDSVEVSRNYNCSYVNDSLIYFHGVYRKPNGDFILKEFDSNDLLLIHRQRNKIYSCQLPLASNEWLSFNQSSGFISHGDTILVQVNQRDLTAPNFLRYFILKPFSKSYQIAEFLRFPQNYLEQAYGGNDYMISFCEFNGKILAGFPKSHQVYTDVANVQNETVELNLYPPADLGAYDANLFGAEGANNHYLKSEFYQDLMVNNETNKIYRLLLRKMNDSLAVNTLQENRPFTIIELDENMSIIRSVDFSAEEYDTFSLVPFKKGFLLRAKTFGDTLLSFHYFE